MKMKLIISGKIIDSSELIDIKRSGESGNVYRYNDLAIKIRKGNSSEYNDERKYIFDRLKEVEGTNKIIIPKDLIYDVQGNIIGYTMPFIYGGHGEKINTLTTKFLLEELKLIVEDIKKLTENNIVFNDSNTNNIIVNENGIFLIDSDGFLFETKNDYNKYFVQSLQKLCNMIKACFEYDKYVNNNYFELNQAIKYYYDIHTMLEKSKKKDEKVNLCVKRLIKKQKFENIINYFEV